MNKQEAIAAAITEYENARGSIIRPEEIFGMVDGMMVRHIANDDGRIAVRVIDTPPQDIALDTGGYIDPVWEVDAVEDPNGETLGLGSTFIYAAPQEYEV